MIAYLLKVNVAIALFYAFYKLLLCRDTFFTWRRVALLAFIMVSITLPLINCGSWIGQSVAVKGMAEVYANIVLPEVVIGGDAASTADWHSVAMSWCGIMYWAVLSLLMLRFLSQLASILRLYVKSEKREIEGVRVCILDKKAAPFSFFKIIFINPESHAREELREILAHEQAHARQYHSLDVILGELACMVFWYNPFMWLVKNEIRNNLEYMADHRVISEGYDTKNYQYHLLGLTYQKAAANLYNNFNVLPLKERIKMMNKKRTKGIGMAKYLLLLPLVAMLVIGSNIDSVASTTNAVSTSKGLSAVSSDKDVDKAYKVVEVMPEFPGGNGAMMKYLKENLKYPEDAKKNGVQGTVVVRFVVKADGTVDEVKVMKGLESSLDSEAMRLVKSLPKFKPGTKGGEPVDVWYTLPVMFKIPSAK